MPEISDAELDAATEAYVRERWKNVADWRKAYPGQSAWNETRERIRITLAAAAKVRSG